MLVGDVVRTLDRLNLSKSYNINVIPKGYEILSWFPRTEGQDQCISFKDLQCLQQLNRARIQDYGIKLFASTNTTCIRVVVLSHKEPAMVEELVAVYKRKRWDR